MNDHELDLTLDAIAASRTHVSASPALRERVRAVPLEVPQRRAWLPQLTGRFGSMYSATRFVVAGAIVALFGGFLLAGVLTQPSDESVPNVGASATPDAATLPAVELPAEIPEGIDSGTLDTPIGPARWVRLSGDGETLPGILGPVPVPGGYVSLGGLWGDPGGLWFSSDLLEWNRRGLPAEPVLPGLTPGGGSYWLTTAGEEETEPPSLWWSPDALTWEEIDLSGLEPHLSADIDWRIGFGTPATSSGVTVVPVRYEMQNGRDFFGSPALPGVEDRFSEPVGLVRSEDGSYSLVADLGDELERVRFEETDAGLRIIDASTGDVLAKREGMDLDAIKRLAGDMDVIGDYRLAIVDGGAVRIVDLPEPDVGTVPKSFHVIGTDGGFRAFQRRSDRLMQTWTSPDGFEWMLDEVLGDDPGEPEVPFHVHEPWADPTGDWRDPDLVVARVAADGVGDTVWVSTDGLEWQVEPPGRPVAGEPPGFRFGSDWTVTLLPDGLAFYPAGSGEPTVVDIPDGMLARDGNAGSFHPLGANTIALSVYEGADGLREQTIITFDDFLASGRR